MSPAKAAKSDLAKIAIERGVGAGDEWVTVPAAQIRKALQGALAEGYTFYSFITCVDHLARLDGRPPHTGESGGAGPRFEMVYELRDLDTAWEEFSGMRAKYAAWLNLTTKALRVPPAPWIGDRSYLPHRDRPATAHRPARRR